MDCFEENCEYRGWKLCITEDKANGTGHGYAIKGDSVITGYDVCMGAGEMVYEKLKNYLRNEINRIEHEAEVQA